MTPVTDPDQSQAVEQRTQAALAPVALVDLLDRLLGQGVVLSGDLVISLAGVDLVEVHLHALIASVRSETRRDGRE